jgi:hypothetical protein
MKTGEEKNRIGHSTEGDNSPIDGDIFIQSGNANTIQSATQNNVHGKNIYAQTVNVYECPKELIELIKKLSPLVENRDRQRFHSFMETGGCA